MLSEGVIEMTQEEFVQWKPPSSRILSITGNDTYIMVVPVHLTSSEDAGEETRSTSCRSEPPAIPAS